MSKKILYVDMDNVLVDFSAALNKTDSTLLRQFEGRHDEIPGLFAQMPPVADALESYALLAQWFDTFILSTAPWDNPSAWIDKLVWVKKHLGEVARKRLILTHHKNMNYGHYLIDDRPNNGAKDFNGEWIQFGSQLFPNWERIVEYLKERK